MGNQFLVLQVLMDTRAANPSPWSYMTHSPIAYEASETPGKPFCWIVFYGGINFVSSQILPGLTSPEGFAVADEILLGTRLKPGFRTRGKRNSLLLRRLASLTHNMLKS